MHKGARAFDTLGVVRYTACVTRDVCVCVGGVSPCGWPDFRIFAYGAWSCPVRRTSFEPAITTSSRVCCVFYVMHAYGEVLLLLLLGYVAKLAARVALLPSRDRRGLSGVVGGIAP